MITEVIDKNSGAILFKKDKDSITIEKLLKQVEELENRVAKLEKKSK